LLGAKARNGKTAAGTFDRGYDMTLSVRFYEHVPRSPVEKGRRHWQGEKAGVVAFMKQMIGKRMFFVKHGESASIGSEGQIWYCLWAGTFPGVRGASARPGINT
jgi:hypothetical protein